MAKLSEQFIEDVRSSTDIADLISEYVALTPRGKSLFGLCPFHNESSPSFSVSPDKQLYHCFGCGASGNAITFIRDLENRTFVESVLVLAERLGLETPHIDHNEQSVEQSMSQHKQLFELHEVAAQFYHHLLLHTVEGEEALAYLKERGFTEETIEKYQIGWAPFEKDALYHVFEQRQFDREQMVQSTLIQYFEKDETYRDRFRGRVMFPLFDDSGKVIAFSGRLLKKDEKSPKYMNSPQSPIFEKSEVLYNLHVARPSIRQERKVIVFEGFMDSIAAQQVSIEHTVAVMGTSLSTTHLMKIKRMTSDVLFCCDGDEAGFEASFRFAQLATKEGLHPQIALLPDGYDPDDYIQTYGKTQFEEKVLQPAHSYMSFVMIYYKRHKNLHQPDDVTQYIHEVLAELAHRTSPIERDFILNELHSETNVSMEALEQQLLHEEKRKKRWKRTVEETAPPPLITPHQKREGGKSERAELLLLSHFIYDYDLFRRMMQKYPKLFVQEPFQLIAIELAAFTEMHDKENVQRFFEQFDDPTLGEIVSQAAQIDRATDDVEREVEDCILFLERYRIERKIQEKMNEAKQAEKDRDMKRAIQLAAEIVSLRRSLCFDR